MKRALVAATAALALGTSGLATAAPQSKNGNGTPRYVVDPFWPKDLPDNLLLGQVAGVAVDNQDNVWIIHRPKSLVDDEKGAQKTPPETRCCKPASSVLQFSPDGRLLKSWGGPGQGYDWPKNEHGIHIDKDGNVWLGGNDKDDQILKFTPDGKFLLQVGKADTPGGSNSTTRLGRPAHMVTDPAGELYVADGYGNRRIVVFDAKTGQYKRPIGAPMAPRRPPTTNCRPISRSPSPRCRSRSPTQCIACASPATAWSTCATVPTTASRCSRRTARS
jgi:hypothetical protein